jgi:hypothetical protein
MTLNLSDDDMDEELRAALNAMEEETRGMKKRMVRPPHRRLSKNRPQLAGRPSLDRFDHLSGSIRNLGQRKTSIGGTRIGRSGISPPSGRSSSPNNVGALMNPESDQITSGPAVRSHSIWSTDGCASMDGIFGDSEGELSRGDDDEASLGMQRLERRDVNGIPPSKFEAMSRSFGKILPSIGNTFDQDDGFSKQNISFDRYDGDYGLNVDEVAEQTSHISATRRHPMNRKLRSESMQPQFDRKDYLHLDEETVDSVNTTSSKGRLHANQVKEVEFLDGTAYYDVVGVVSHHPSDSSLSDDSAGDIVPALESHPARENEVYNMSHGERLEHSISSISRLKPSRQSSIPVTKARRSSYINVMSLSINPDGTASIMDSSQAKGMSMLPNTDVQSEKNSFSNGEFDNDYDEEYDDDYFTAFEMLCAPSFSQFALLEIRPEQLLLLENEYLFADDGPNHLDPFVLRQDLDFGHHYSSDINQPIDPISVASFCFPDGLRIRYIPKAAMEGASRIGWVGPSGDSCHVLVFTNVHGVTEHGVAITIRWEINLKTRERQELSKAVYFRRRRRRAARKIQKWWRKKTLDYVLKNALKISGFYGISPEDLKAELTGPEIKLLEKTLKVSHEDPMQQLISAGKNPHISRAKKQTKMSLVNKLNVIMNRNHKDSTSVTKQVDSQLVTEVTRAAIFRSQSAMKFQDDSIRDSLSSDYRIRTPLFRSQSPTVAHENRMKDSMSSDKSNDFESDNSHLRGRSIMKNLSGLSGTKFSTRSFQSGRSLLSTATPSRHRRITKRPQPRVIELARESYDTMKENDKLGSICIVEKCYTLIGCQPDEHVILLGPLQQLIDSERAEILDFRKAYNDMTLNEGNFTKKTNAVEDERTMEADIKQRRHNIVQAMREKLRLTTRQALTKYPRSQCEHVYGKVSYFETVIPQIPNCELIKLPLPLPRIGKEWALAQFLLDIGPDSLVLCLKLMLLEHSILILGEELQKVSMFACALIELLKPFEWVSAFMPVLPRKMLDFVNCPVPFIAGVAVRNVVDVENDSRVLEAMNNGMSLLNLKNNTLQITSEKNVSGMLSLDPYLREQLKTLVGRLRHYEQADRNSSLRDFGRFVQNGLSRRESLTLHSVCQVLEKHFSFLCKDLAANDTAWKRYGTVDINTNEFRFNPDWFLNTVRSEQSFHDMMARTQLFSSYVHERRQDGIEMREIMEGEMGYFIAEWIYEKWMMKKKRHNPKGQIFVQSKYSN